MSGRPFTILSLSGGGFCGLYTLRVLELLEEKRNNTPLSKSVDMICGTSVGGLIAVGLSLGFSAKQIREIFEKNGPRVFNEDDKDHALTRRRKKAISKLSGLFFSKYNSELLGDIVRPITQDKPLNDCIRPTFVTSVQYSDRKARIIRSYEGENISCYDAVMATSAAPTYFNPHMIGQDRLIDGGIIANNPDIIGISEAMSSFGMDIDRIYMLSVGTTRSDNSGSLRFARLRGTLPRLFGLNMSLAFVMDAQQQLSSQLSENLLSNRYHRINMPVNADTSGYLAIDRADNKAREMLLSLASDSAKDIRPNECIRQFLNASVEAPNNWRGNYIYG